MTFKVERRIGAENLTIETEKLARQAHGAALVRYGETVVLGTVVTGPPRPGIDFFPLQVDYREKMSAAGKFPGGFFKREGRPTAKEILTMRMIDRPVRPLFPKGFKDEVQIQLIVISADTQTDPDIVGMAAAAAALAVAPLPFQGPVASVRVGHVDGEFIINPTRSQLEYSDLDLIVAGTPQAINMIEIGSRELSEKVVADSIKFGHENGIIPVCEMLEELKHHAGKPSEWEAPEVDAAFMDEIHKLAWDELVAAKTISGKQERYAACDAVYQKIVEHFCPEDVEKPEHDPLDVRQGSGPRRREDRRPPADSEGARPAGRPRPGGHPADLGRGGLAAARARFFPVPARRDAGDGDDHARLPRRMSRSSTT